jgi:NitT/TauT family transport system substrate-binding protein
VRSLALLLLGVLTACGGTSPTSSPTGRGAEASSSTPAATTIGPPSASPTATRIRVQLRGTIRAEFAGFIDAIDEGYYDAADLDVTFVESPAGQDPVAAGSAADGPEFTVAWVPAVLAARGTGASDLVDIGQLFQRSGTLSISRKDDAITGPVGFRDKTVGTFGFGDGAEVLAAAMKARLKAGTDFEVATQDADLDGPLPRRLDVAQTTIYDGYARVLESTNPKTGAQYTTSDLNVIDWYDEGTALLQDAIFSRASWLALDGNESIAQRFLKATFQGWIHCREHADDCVQATLAAGERPVVSSGSAGASPLPGIASQRPPATPKPAATQPAGSPKTAASAKPAASAKAAGSPKPAASPNAGGSAKPAPSAAPPAVPSLAPSPATPVERPTFGPGHTAWSMNEVNALVWPAPLGIGVVDQGVWQHTVDVCLAAGFIPSAPPDEALRSDLAKAALAELSDLDTTGLSFAKSSVAITPGGE